MNNIILTTVLPGLNAFRDSEINAVTVNYEEWLKLNSDWQKHTGQEKNVISDLHMITLQCKDILSNHDLIIFSSKNWNDLGSSFIKTSFYVHLHLDCYTSTELGARIKSQFIQDNISDLSKWNNNCCRLRTTNPKRSFVLEKGEMLMLQPLLKAAAKSDSISVQAIENLNLIHCHKNKVIKNKLTYLNKEK